MQELTSPVVYEKIYKNSQSVDLKRPLAFKDEIEGLKWQFFNVGNPYLSKDGRTYNARDKNGLHISNYVSQYSGIISKNIEEEIRELILKLHDKGYLTVGSCQSHVVGERRWIGLVFYSSDLRNKFMSQVSLTKIPMYFEYDLPMEPRDQDLNHFIADEVYKTKIWQILVCRNYEKFYPLRWVIGVSQAPQKDTVLSWFKFYWYEFVTKKMYLKKYTARLTEYVSKLSPYEM